MVRPIAQSQIKAKVARPMKSNTLDSTYRRHTKTNSTAGVRKALKRFLDFERKHKSNYYNKVQKVSISLKNKLCFSNKRKQTTAQDQDINPGLRCSSSDLIVLAKWIPHLLQLLLQLCLVSVTKLLATHLLGGGEAVKSLPQVKLVFFLKRFGSHVGQVATTNLGGKAFNECL